MTCSKCNKPISVLDTGQHVHTDDYDADMDHCPVPGTHVIMRPHCGFVPKDTSNNCRWNPPYTKVLSDARLFPDYAAAEKEKLSTEIVFALSDL